MLPAEILSLAGLFPIAPDITATQDLDAVRIDQLRSLFWYLPPADEAADLRHIYFQHAGASLAVPGRLGALPILTPRPIYSMDVCPFP